MFRSMEEDEAYRFTNDGLLLALAVPASVVVDTAAAATTGI
jgi:hypothetical protein